MHVLFMFACATTGYATFFRVLSAQYPFWVMTFLAPRSMLILDYDVQKESLVPLCT
jgi:hypothetical protein